MKNNTQAIKGTEIICKGNVESNFELVPMELLDYVQLDLISHTDLTIYIKMLQLYNENYGYAFPTILQLMNHTRIKSKSTVHKSLKTLENIGLIKRGKYAGKNNIYVVYKPLPKKELYALFPDKVQQLIKFEESLNTVAEIENERYRQHYKDTEINVIN